MRVPEYRSISKCCAVLLVAAALGVTAVCFVGSGSGRLVADEPRAASEQQQRQCLELLLEIQTLRAQIQQLNEKLELLSQRAHLLARQMIAESDGEVAPEASVNDKYSHLLRKIAVPEDQPGYGDFYDYGYWSGTSWHGHTDLPPGYWVYVFPHWYIWRDCHTQPQQ